MQFSAWETRASSDVDASFPRMGNTDPGTRKEVYADYLESSVVMGRDAMRRHGIKTIEGCRRKSSGTFATRRTTIPSTPGRFRGKN